MNETIQKLKAIINVLNFNLKTRSQDILPTLKDILSELEESMTIEDKMEELEETIDSVRARYQSKMNKRPFMWRDKDTLLTKMWE